MVRGPMTKRVAADAPPLDILTTILTAPDERAAEREREAARLAERERAARVLALGRKVVTLLGMAGAAYAQTWQMQAFLTARGAVIDPTSEVIAAGGAGQGRLTFSLTHPHGSLPSDADLVVAWDCPTCGCVVRLRDPDAMWDIGEAVRRHRCERSVAG